MIRFGTDGWRALIARDFTFGNVTKIANAFSRFLLDFANPPKGIVVSFDTRFLSDQFAEHFAAVVAGYNIPVILSDRFTPTPVLSFAVKHLNLNAGVMITASHNPYFYNGIKFKAEYGGPVLDDFTANVEKRIQETAVTNHEMPVPQQIQRMDLITPYSEHLKTLLRMEVLEKFSPSVAYDAMHGCGIGVLQYFFDLFDWPVSYLHHQENPLFNRRRPEPVADNLPELRDLLLNGKQTLGMATDGDADRCAVLDEKGRFVQLHDLMPLLAQYLIRERKLSGNFVRTTSMHHTIDLLAGEFRRQVTEVPVGFKNVTGQMLKNNVLLGGEESGGFGYGFHLPERDGIFTLLLVLEMLGHYEVNISQLVNGLRQKYGDFFYLRKDLTHAQPQILRQNLDSLRNNPPDRILDQQVVDFSLKDGLKLYLANGCWILIRVSQTEPLARIYVGGSNERAVKAILNWGIGIISKDTAKPSFK